MAYVLNQFNQVQTDLISTSDTRNTKYLKPITDGTAKRRLNEADKNVTVGRALINFYDECLKFESSLSNGTHYYFHCKIKRLQNNQTFNVYLVNYQNTSTTGNRTQFLKTINVQGSNTGEWADFEIIFTPLLSFDCILFQLERTVEDYTTVTDPTTGDPILNTRYPVIVYEEFDEVNNLLDSLTDGNSKIYNLLKMGIQSHPGLLMCVNGEEIQIGRNGVYEVRNGIVSVDFLSIVKAAKESDETSFNALLDRLAALPYERDKNRTNSVCIFADSKVRSIDTFTLDYLCEEVKITQ